MLVLDSSVGMCDGRFSTSGRCTTCLLPIGVPKCLYREVQVGQFRIVLHAGIKYGFRIFIILNHDLQTIFFYNYISSCDINTLSV